jgi:hypothetical protein
MVKATHFATAIQFAVYYELVHFEARLPGRLKVFMA